jgi:coenzyme Q-binding protein COQ10
MWKYPLFVPLCEDLHILRRAPSGEGVEVLVADMSVGYKAIRESFTSRATLDRPRLKILAEYVDGPFSDLQNCWSFQPVFHRLHGGILHHLRISQPYLGFADGVMFDRAFRKFAEAFERRADVVYGVPGPLPLPTGV